MYTANEQYLRSAVMTASPARLRLMLLDRAVALTGAIRESRDVNPAVLTDERTVTLRGILGELLSGVSRGENTLATQVADLYVFLLQELTRAEQEPGTERIESIGSILAIEQETWRQVCQLQLKRSSQPCNPAAMRAKGESPAAAQGALNFSA